MPRSFSSEETLSLPAEVIRGGGAVWHDRRHVAVIAEFAPVSRVVTCNGGLLGSCALWVDEATDGGAGLASPPTVEWELWAVYGTGSVAVPGASGNLSALTTWSNTTGTVVRVANLLAEGYELRAHVDGAGPIRLKLRWLVGPAATVGGALTVALGSLHA